MLEEFRTRKVIVNVANSQSRPTITAKTEQTMPKIRRERENGGKKKKRKERKKEKQRSNDKQL